MTILQSPGDHLEIYYLVRKLLQSRTPESSPALRPERLVSFGILDLIYSDLLTAEGQVLPYEVTFLLSLICLTFLIPYIIFYCSF